MSKSVEDLTAGNVEFRRIDSERDIAVGITFLLKADTRLKRISAIAGVPPLRRRAPDFEGLVDVVISQHVSKASAASVFNRLRELITPINAENVANCLDSDLVKAGLTRAKQKTIRGAALAVKDGQIDLQSLCLAPVESAIKQLTALHGIGPWTAEVFLLTCAGHADIFPAGDVALQNAVASGLRLVSKPNEKELRAIAEKWSPWRSVAARLFWSYYANADD